MTPSPSTPRIWSVTEITQALKNTVESAYPEVWISGEISRFTRSTARHVYFTLKDETAVIPAVIYSFSMKSLDLAGVFELKNETELSMPGIVEKAVHGRKVRVCGQLSVYNRSGSYQIVIRRIEMEGVGELQRRFEELKTELKKRGWFDPGRKRSLPPYPRRIGVVTSPTGAVIRDILNVTKRRWDSVDILLYPSLVQGDRAAAEIAAGIRFFNLHHVADVLIVGRGGGSLEDLWAFNEEIVARAIFESHIPVVSAVGHETDFTIADFTADLRAPTPSAAAELVLNRTKAEISARVAECGAKMTLRLKERTAFHRQVLDRITPERLRKNLLKTVELCREKILRRFSAEKMARDLANIAFFHESNLSRLSDSLILHGRKSLEAAGERMRRAADRLNLLDPRGILQRGYSITCLDTAGGPILRSPEDAPAGTRLVTMLAEGRIRSIAEKEEI